MGVIRNHIDIVGITSEEQFPNKIQNGQVIEYSEVENIAIPKYNYNIKNIYQIVLDVKTTSSRTINIPIGNIVVIDGFKKIKILYYDKGRYQKANIIDLKLPYNTFIEVPDGKEISSIDIQIIDAYFELIDEKNLYSHILYLVYAHYKTEDFIGEIEEKSDEEIIHEVGVSAEITNQSSEAFKPLVDIDAEFL